MKCRSSRSAFFYNIYLRKFRNYKSFLYFYEKFVDMEKLTAQEEQVMKVIWQVGKGNVKSFIEIGKLDMPYTTVASIVKNLEKKHFLKTSKKQNAYEYEPIIFAQQYADDNMQVVVDDFFDNSYKNLVSFFLEQEKINQEELEEILLMIKNKQ